MAQRVTVALIDDLDGTEAEETVSFGLDGKQYEIDLSEKNSRGLREVLADFVGAARKSGSTSANARRNLHSAVKSVTSSTTAEDRERNTAIRAWANQQGMKVADRGRIPAEVIDAYENRTNGVPAPRQESKPEPTPEPVSVGGYYNGQVPTFGSRKEFNAEVKAWAAATERDGTLPELTKAWEADNGKPEIVKS